MINSFLTWLAKFFLDLALRWVRREIERARKIKEDEKTSEENAKRYDEAKTREEQIRRAIDLINGTSP